MFYKILLALILSLSAGPSFAETDRTALVGFDLSLAGYRLGMSYDDAAQMGPLRFDQPDTENPGEAARFYVVIDSVDVEGVDMTLCLSFRNDRLYKIVAKILPGTFVTVRQRFQNALGEAENRSREFRCYNGVEVRMVSYRWTFPNAILNLVETSSVTDYATIGLVSR